MGRFIEPRFDRFPPTARAHARVHFFLSSCRNSRIASRFTHDKKPHAVKLALLLASDSNVREKSAKMSFATRFRRFDVRRQIDISVFFPRNAPLFHMHRNTRAGISYNEASLSKIKQRPRRILAVALFVRMCKQWNYPFPARIYPDDIQPVADLPTGKHSRFYGYARMQLCRVNKFEEIFFAQVSLRASRQAFDKKGRFFLRVFTLYKGRIERHLPLILVPFSHFKL